MCLKIRRYCNAFNRDNSNQHFKIFILKVKIELCSKVEKDALMYRPELRNTYFYSHIRDRDTIRFEGSFGVLRDTRLLTTTTGGFLLQLTLFFFHTASSAIQRNMTVVYHNVKVRTIFFHYFVTFVFEVQYLFLGGINLVNNMSRRQIKFVSVRKHLSILEHICLTPVHLNRNRV